MRSQQIIKVLVPLVCALALSACSKGKNNKTETPHVKPQVQVQPSAKILGISDHGDSDQYLLEVSLPEGLKQETFNLVIGGSEFSATSTNFAKKADGTYAEKVRGFSLGHFLQATVVRKLDVVHETDATGTAYFFVREDLSKLGQLTFAKSFYFASMTDFDSLMTELDYAAACWEKDMHEIILMWSKGELSTQKNGHFNCPQVDNDENFEAPAGSDDVDQVEAGFDDEQAQEQSSQAKPWDKHVLGQ